MRVDSDEVIYNLLGVMSHQATVYQEVNIAELYDEGEVRESQPRLLTDQAGQAGQVGAALEESCGLAAGEAEMAGQGEDETGLSTARRSVQQDSSPVRNTPVSVPGPGLQEPHAVRRQSGAGSVPASQRLWRWW